MQIVTWNVNSIKARMPHLLQLTEQERPDVILLQEIKTTYDNFPHGAVEELGYNLAVCGQKSYNGVAILAKSRIEDIRFELPGAKPEEARYIEGVVSIGAVTARVASIYVPQGTEVGSDRFFYKLEYYNYLNEHFHNLAKYSEIFVAGGDYNVAVEEIDVYSPKQLAGQLGFHIDERIRMRSILNGVMHDSYRAVAPDIQQFSWWDYRSNGWKYNKGMRIDYILLSSEGLDKLESAGVYEHYRGLERASDHVPVYCKLR
ncbi:MAG: exodeoxyribonuclease III [Proteobacteria bacterium]|nr:exodeoxyribonuclease III [Pseudomonadota bacterium]